MKLSNAITSRAGSVRWVLVCAIGVGTSLMSFGSARADEKGLSYQWTLGSSSDVQENSPAHFTDAQRVGVVGTDGDIHYRELKPKIYQAAWKMPAFDMDVEHYNEIAHPFFLTVHFKDVAKSPVKFMAYKGGAGFYGKGWIGTLGGAGDGQWKDQTLVIPQSMMRSPDGKTFELGIRDVPAAIPVSSMTLFSAAATDIPDKDKKIADAIADDNARRDAVMAFLKKTKFKELPLPAADPAPPITDEETTAGYRIFFPPSPRALYGNSQPHPDELTAKQTWYAAPGQTEFVTIGVRGLKNVGEVSLKLSSLKGPSELALSDLHIRWAKYRDFRIGSSWATDYRPVPNELIDQPSQTVGPDRLEIAAITFTVPESAQPGDYQAALDVTAEHGQPRSVPVIFTVYPFKLEHPDHATHSEFYYVDYGAFDPLELQDMRYHGIDGVVSGMVPPLGHNNPDGTYPMEKEILNGYAMLKELGFKSPVICSLGLGWATNKDTPDNEKDYIHVARAAKELADKAGFDVALFPIDEPHTPELIAKAKLACKWIHEIPARTYITSNPNLVKSAGNLLDDVGYNITYLNEKTVDAVHKDGQTLMYYTGSVGHETGSLRYRTGYYYAKLEPANAQFFAYFECADDPENDLDAGNTDWTSNYPSMYSPYHNTSLGWESFREGVNDYQYIYTLRAMADRAAKAGHTAAANKALAVVDSVLSKVSLDGNKAGGPELAVEADTSLKNVKVKAEEFNTQSAGWYNQSRQQIAQAIIELQQESK